MKTISENEDCEEKTIEELCKINPENLKKKLPFINYVNIKSIKNNKINHINKYIDEYPGRAIRIIKKYDILYSTVRPNLKGYTIVNQEYENMIATSGLAVIRSKVINPIYIYNLIIDENINKYLISKCGGSSYPAFDSEIFKEIKLKIPKNKQLIKDMEPQFQELEQLHVDVKNADKKYKDLIEELKNEAIK